MKLTNKFCLPDCLDDCNDFFIAGGAVISHLMQQEPNDFDVYPFNKESAKHIVETLYHNSEFVAHTDRAITFLSYDKDSTGRRIPIQVVPFDEFPTAEKVFSTFDFSVCMVAVDHNGAFYYGENALEDLIARRITYNRNSLFPMASLVRLAKYRKKGFHVPKSTELAISMCVAANGMPSTWEEAEGLIGGYYGKVFKFQQKDNIPFSLDAVLDAIEGIKDFDACAESTTQPSLDEILYKIDPVPKPHIILNGKSIEVMENNILGKSLSFGAWAVGDKKEFPLIQSYKYVVKRADGRLQSQYNSTFEYKVGEVARAPSHPWLYSSKVLELYKRNDGVLIEVYTLPEHVKDYKYSESSGAILQSETLYVHRIVPDNEIERLKNKELVMGVDLNEHTTPIYNALKYGNIPVIAPYDPIWTPSSINNPFIRFD